MGGGITNQEFLRRSSSLTIGLLSSLPFVVRRLTTNGAEPLTLSLSKDRQRPLSYLLGRPLVNHTGASRTATYPLLLVDIEVTIWNGPSVTSIIRAPWSNKITGV